MKDAEPCKERMIRYSFHTQVGQIDHVEKNGRLILQWIPARLTSDKTNGDHGLVRTQSRGASSTLKVHNFRNEKKMLMLMTVVFAVTAVKIFMFLIGEWRPYFKFRGLLTVICQKFP